MKLDHLLTTRGRINRTEFLFRYSVYLLIAILLLEAASFLPESVRPAIELLLYILFWIMVFVLTVQRVHDYDEPAWYALLILVPVVNIFVIFNPGVIAPNKYGDPPPSPSGKKTASDSDFSGFAFPAHVSKYKTVLGNMTSWYSLYEICRAYRFNSIASPGLLSISFSTYHVPNFYPCLQTDLRWPASTAVIISRQALYCTVTSALS